MKKQNNLVKEALANACFEIVVSIRKMNMEDAESCNEIFAGISPERQQQLLDNIDHIIQNPNITAKEEHAIWASLKIKDGWKYGPVTDRANKIHNCLVPYENLNFYQRLKDHLVIETVKLFYNL